MPPPPPTQRLLFRRWTPDDSGLASSLWSDERVMHFLGGPYSAAEVIARLERETTNDATFDIQYWPVFAGDRFAGCCGLKPHEPVHRFYEIGFHFLPEFWGRGYASEASRAVIKHGLEVVEAAELYAGHHPENAASRALLERLGFTQIGTHYFERTGLQHPWYQRRLQ